jgi:NADH dehydrogenase
LRRPAPCLTGFDPATRLATKRQQTLASGEKILAHTVIWTGGMRANPLTEQLPGNRDTQDRIAVTRDLRLKDTAQIFAAGDVALARTDDLGNHALMSCQHAVDMGRYAGHNAAADLLGLPTLTYRQPFYVTCLDLGPWGAVYTEGWQREVKMQGAEAKALKRKIVSEWIYPPQAQREVALAAGNPLGTVVGD